MRVTEEVSNILKSYVYIYSDPRDGKVFYIGKGKGNRLFAHLEDQSDTEKTAKITDIQKNGLEPQIDILRYGLTDAQAALIEASAIDLIGKKNLTNRISGSHNGSFARINSHDLIAMISPRKIQVHQGKQSYGKTAKPQNIQHDVVLITINQMYRSDMTDLELYEATRGTWRIGIRRNNTKYAMAIYQGIVREVYQIHQWHPACTLDYQTRDASTLKRENRWEFEGEIATELRDQYIGFSVGKSGQNPIRYITVD